jgi:hypothetical protein
MGGNLHCKISLCLLSPQGGSEQHHQQSSTAQCLYMDSRAGFMEMVFFIITAHTLLHN